MNPSLALLRPYPFQRLSARIAGIVPAAVPAINMAIGEPRHCAPSLICDDIRDGLAALSTYPSTRGTAPLRTAIADWLTRRFALPAGRVDPDRHVLPVSGSREALFSVVQTAVNTEHGRPIVIMPNPFYQIYEGAALLAGAEPYYVNTCRADDYRMDFTTIPPAVWARTQVVFVCSPGNPTGQIVAAADYQVLLERSRTYGFLIAADECYAELYTDEAQPSPGLLGVAAAAGIDDFARCIVFHSLSKRSNVPGLRAGFVAGDGDFLNHYLTYRTYQGAAPSMLAQNALRAALSDETHVVANRAEYRRKFDAVIATLGRSWAITRPAGGFYLWLPVPGDDEDFVAGLYQEHNVLALPGRYLSRPTATGDPGVGFIRLALVGSLEECQTAALRLRTYMESIA
ncbi:MAG: succinyldiaminopimelate transaminase [Acidiferrobacter sp.]